VTWFCVASAVVDKSWLHHSDEGTGWDNLWCVTKCLPVSASPQVMQFIRRKISPSLYRLSNCKLHMHHKWTYRIGEIHTWTEQENLHHTQTLAHYSWRSIRAVCLGMRSFVHLHIPWWALIIKFSGLFDVESYLSVWPTLKDAVRNKAKGWLFQVFSFYNMLSSSPYCTCQ
jgi:hypothetical protein